MTNPGRPGRAWGGVVPVDSAPLADVARHPGPARQE